MILLDTNVVSELLRQQPDDGVLSWINRQPPESVWTTAVTVFEVRLGLEILEPGRRRHALEDAFVQMLMDDLDGRVLPFDDVAAEAAGKFAAERRRLGRSIEIRDAQIAGIAIARKAAIATRNVRHFEGSGVSLINPWAATEP